MIQKSCDQGTCDCYQRPQIDLAFLFTLMLLVALWLACWSWTSAGSKVVSAIMALTYLFGCWRTRRAVLVLLPGIYVPYVWLLFDWPWDSYRLQWIALLWQIPGLVVEMVVHPLQDWLFELVTVMATLVFFFAALLPARWSHRSALFTGLIVFTLSLVASYLCHLAFLA